MVTVFWMPLVARDRFRPGTTAEMSWKLRSSSFCRSAPLTALDAERHFLQRFVLAACLNDNSRPKRSLRQPARAKAGVATDSRLTLASASFPIMRMTFDSPESYRAFQSFCKNPLPTIASRIDSDIPIPEYRPDPPAISL